VKSKEHIILTIIILLNIIGAIGFNIISMIDYFKILTPYNICFTLILTLYILDFKKFIKPFIYIYFTSMIIESFGVKTGVLFGEYQYGETLGIKTFGVPLVIGVNWFILAIATRGSVENLKINNLNKSLLSSMIMVLLDFLIEPVAIKLNFWSWNGGYIPIQNYLMWFGVSFIIQTFILKNDVKILPKLGFTLLISQLIFFLALQEYV